MTSNEQNSRRAGAELARLKREAFNRLVDLHPDALPHGLNQYGPILRTPDLAAVMSQRESRLTRKYEMDLEALRKKGSYDRSWIGLLRLLRDLTLRRGLP